MHLQSSKQNLDVNGFFKEINMASSKEYLEFVLEQLSDLEEITYSDKII